MQKMGITSAQTRLVDEIASITSRHVIKKIVPIQNTIAWRVCQATIEGCVYPQM